MNYTKGQRFRLNRHHGVVEPHADPDYEAFLDRNHPLFEGQIGEVVQVVGPEEDGAGNHDEEHVVLAFDYCHPSTQEPVAGRRNVPDEAPRLVSFTQAEMDSMFVEDFEYQPTFFNLEGGPPETGPPIALAPPAPPVPAEVS